MNIRWLRLGLGLWLLAMLQPVNATPVYVRFNTTSGNIDVELLPDDAPATVANFLTYVDSGAYTNSIVHRSVAGFIWQGGGFDFVNNNVSVIPANAPVVNEYKDSNIRGTLAMAKLSTGPDTATNQWFFNLADNSANLDNQNGGFTVFGKVTNSSGLAVMDAVAALSTFPFSSPFDSLPLYNYTVANFNANTPVPLADFVYINSISRLTVTNFSTWQATNFPGQPTSVSAPSAIPQNDGVTNMIKYLCDVTPTGSMTAADRAKLPVVGSTTVAGATVMTLTYHQRQNLVGVFVTVQTSTDLATWATATNATTTQTGTDGSGDPIMQVQVPVPAAGTQFMRLSVTQ